MEPKKKRVRRNEIITETSDYGSTKDFLYSMLAEETEDEESLDDNNENDGLLNKELDPIEHLFSQENKEAISDIDSLSEKEKKVVKDHLEEFMQCFQKEAQRFESEFKTMVQQQGFKKKTFHPKAEHKHEKLVLKPFFEKLKATKYSGSDLEFIDDNEFTILETITNYQQFTLNWMLKFEKIFKEDNLKIEKVFELLSPKMKEERKLTIDVYELREKNIFCDYEFNYITFIFCFDLADVFYLFLTFELTKQDLKQVEKRVCKIPEQMNDFLNKKAISKEQRDRILDYEIKFINKFYFMCGCTNY